MVKVEEPNLSERLRLQVLAIVSETCGGCGRPRTTPREVAKAMKVSPSTLTRWLAQKNSPSAHLLDAADAYVMEKYFVEARKTFDAE